jgi:hypothetical protein
MKKLSCVKYRWHEKADFQESIAILRFDVSQIDCVREHFFCRDVQAVQVYVALPVHLNTPECMPARVNGMAVYYMFQLIKPSSGSTHQQLFSNY